MLVHQCIYCGRISKNRIAGDDNEYSLITLLDKVERGEYGEMDIDFLGRKDEDLVRLTLFGISG